MKKVDTSIMLTCFVIACIGLSATEYVHWKPEQWNGKELLCDNSNCMGSKNYDICCSCHSKAPWEIKGNQNDLSDQSMYVEYIDLNYDAKILTLAFFNTSESSKLIHRNGKLKKLPFNVCNYYNTVLVDLTSNRLVSIDGIQCLRNLEILNLDNNNLQHLSNKTFKNLTNLRTVSLANNLITDMEPLTLSGESINIFNFNISGNYLKVIDVTNLVMDKLYCNINYEKNQFQVISNALGWKVNISQQYGTGMVSVGFNPPMHFPNYEELGFPVKQFPKLFKILRNTNFNFGSNAFICDCYLEPILRYSHIWKPDYSFVFPNFPDFNCSDKGPNAGINAVLFLHEEERERLVCNLDSNVNCPTKCHCYDQPSLDRIVVNCTGQRFDHSEYLALMPNGIGHNLELILTKTGLKSLTMHKYFERVSFIDLSNNSFNSIESFFLGNSSLLENLNTLKILHHNLRRIPLSLKQLLVDPNKLILGETPIECDCQNVWIGEWRTLFKVNKSVNPLLCKVDGKIVDSESVTSEFLGCNITTFQWTWLVILTSVVIAVMTILVALLITFKYELQILFRFLRQVSQNSINHCYDVFISYDVNDFDIRNWVLNGLRRELVNNGLKVYDTFLDTLPGSVREEVTITKMNQSKHLLIILSRAYMEVENSYCGHEFRDAIKQYLHNTPKTLTLVNFDNIKSSETSDPYMKAFIRLGLCMTFADRFDSVTRKINKRIMKKCL